MAKRVPLSTVMLEIAAKAIWLVLHFYILNFTFLAEIAKRSSSEEVLPKNCLIRWTVGQRGAAAPHTQLCCTASWRWGAGSSACHRS